MVPGGTGTHSTTGTAVSCEIAGAWVTGARLVWVMAGAGAPYRFFDGLHDEDVEALISRKA